MTEEKAISLLSWLEVEDSGIYNRQWYHGIKEDLEEALEMAMSALEQQQKDKELAAEVVENARKIKEPCITETEMDEYIKNENPKLILSSVDEDEYKDVLKEPYNDAISKNNVITTICQYGTTKERAGQYMITASEMKQDLVDLIDSLPSVHPSRCKECAEKALEISKYSYSCGKQDSRGKGKCKNCKYFEYDSVAKVNGIPLIVAHEICNKWGNGCKTSEDGYCYLFEPQESEEQTE